MSRDNLFFIILSLKQILIYFLNLGEFYGRIEEKSSF